MFDPAQLDFAAREHLFLTVDQEFVLVVREVWCICFWHCRLGSVCLNGSRGTKRRFAVPGMQLGHPDSRQRATEALDPAENKTARCGEHRAVSVIKQSG